MTPWKSHLPALGFFLALTAMVSWPLATRLGDMLPIAANPWLRADIDLLVWILAWTSRAIITAPLEIFEATVFHPAPLALTASENLIGLTPISTPVLLATDNPIFTYNFTLLAVTFLTAYTAYRAVRDFEDSLVAGLLAGSLLAFDPLLIHQWARLHESAISLFPLVFMLSFRVARKPTRANFCGLILVTSIQILAGVYLAFILGTFAAGLAPGLIWQARQAGRTGARPLAALLLGTLVPGIVSIPYITRQAGGTYPELQQALEIANLYSSSLGQSLLALSSGTGWLTAPLAILGMANRNIPTAIRLSLLLSLSLGLLLAAGPQTPLLPGTEIPGLYQGLASILPGFATMRAPARFLVICHICLALLSGLGAALLMRTLARRYGAIVSRISGLALLTLAIALIFGSQTVWPIPTTKVPRGPFFVGAYQWLAANGTDGAVLELPAMQSPLEKKPLAQTGRAMRGALRHGLPLINGYSGHPPPSHPLLMAWAHRIPQASALEDFCQYTDLRWIIVHNGMLPEREESLQHGLASWGLQERARFGRDVVYEMPRACGRDTHRLREHIISPEGTTLANTPMRALVPEERNGTITADLAPPWFTNSVHWVDLTIQNQSKVTWPGMTADREHAVSIRAQWVSAAGIVNPCCSLPMLLGRDLGPGEILHTPFLIYAPSAPGDWTLELGLEQRGSGRFIDTGGSAYQRYTMPLVRPDAAVTEKTATPAGLPRQDP